MIETDLKRIKDLSTVNEDQNWKFRSWLKFHAPKNIDKIVSDLSRKYFKLIDCKDCGNCCRSLEIVMKKNDLNIMAKAKGESIKDFTAQYTTIDQDGSCILKAPCPMLNGNLCTTYSDRPRTCQTFPHLEKSGFISRLIGVIGSLSVCPIAFNVFEELKSKLAWTDADE